MSRRVGTYVALGDSYTCGHDPSLPRWADSVAAELGGSVRYFNLAEVGATSADVERHQVPLALDLEPDLVSVTCGANDVIANVRPDAEAYALRLRRIFELLAPATVLIGTYPPFARFLGLRARTRARVEEGMRTFNELIRTVAREHGALLVEGERHPGANGRTSYDADGFHPSRAGHERTAEEVLSVLRRWLRAGDGAAV